MDKCKNCSNHFEYKEIMKSIWLKGYAPIICSECTTKHYVNISTRFILGLSIVSPNLIRLLIGVFFDYYFKFSLITYIAFILIAILITPFYARYHTKSMEERDDGTKALLTSNLSSMESEIIISLLESYDIPYITRSKGIGGAMEIYTGTNNYGIDIYVEPHMLQIARDIINPDNIDKSIT